MSRASRACTYGLVTSWLKLVKRRNSRHTCRGRMATCSGFPVVRLRSVTIHRLSSNSHFRNAPTASGSDFSIAPFVTLRAPYGRGTGNATTAGWLA